MLRAILGRRRTSTKGRPLTQRELEWIKEIRRDKGKEEEDGIPDLDPGLYRYFDAFLACSRSRPSGFGIEPIPLASIAAYCALQSITEPRDKENHREAIQHLDSVWLDVKNDEAEKAAERRERAAKSKAGQRKR